MSKLELPSSPRWGPTLKLVVALTLVAIFAGLLIRFERVMAPLLMALVLAYLFYPIASALQRALRLPWRLTVGLIYLFLLFFLLSALTVSGVGLVQQIQNLVAFVQNSLTAIPGMMAEASGRLYQLGPFQIDFRHLDLNVISQQLLGFVQPVLGQTGTLLGTIASDAAQFLGWTFFVVLISYFALSESGGMRRQIISFDIPGYTEDIHRLEHELTLIWDAFLRGQVVVFLITFMSYSLVFTVLGVNYAVGIAALAGLAKFIPYVGEPVIWVTLALVAYFQGGGPFGLLPLSYAILTVVLAFLIDQTIDNLVSPRIFARALHVHPAAVLIAAVIGASFLGLFGVIIAAPMLATATLFWRYTLRKMLDLDAWPEDTQPTALAASSWAEGPRRIWRRLRERFTRPART